MTSPLIDYGWARLRREEDKMDERYSKCIGVYRHKIICPDRYIITESDSKKGYRITSLDTSGKIFQEKKFTNAEYKKREPSSMYMGTIGPAYRGRPF